MRIDPQPVPLAALVAETLPLVERQARQRKVKLRSAALSGVAAAMRRGCARCCSTC